MMKSMSMMMMMMMMNIHIMMAVLTHCSNDNLPMVQVDEEDADVFVQLNFWLLSINTIEYKKRMKTKRTGVNADVFLVNDVCK